MRQLDLLQEVGMYTFREYEPIWPQSEKRSGCCLLKQQNITSLSIWKEDLSCSV